MGLPSHTYCKEKGIEYPVLCSGLVSWDGASHLSPLDRIEISVCMSMSVSNTRIRIM